MSWSGSCLCGVIAYRADKITRGPIACHCAQCRKQSGHFFAAIRVPEDAVLWTGAADLCWYESSEQMQRGFCPCCGSVLAMRWPGMEYIWLSAGAADDLDLPLTQHVFVPEKGDYYDIDDEMLQTDGLSQPDAREDHA